jgi:6-phosphofructokinase 1
VIFIKLHKNIFYYKDVHVCLVPEFKFELYGEKGVLEYVYNRLKTKRYCVIVVAEGAGDAVLDAKFGKDDSKQDASGNKDLGVIILIFF